MAFAIKEIRTYPRKKHNDGGPPTPAHEHAELIATPDCVVEYATREDAQHDIDNDRRYAWENTRNESDAIACRWEIVEL